MATVKIDKVGIAYSKSGVSQKAYFLFEDDKLVTREFYGSYHPKVDIPENVVTLRELLRFMASYSYHYRFVNIISINNKSTLYEHRFNLTSIEQLRAEVVRFEESVALKLFHDEIVPILKKRNWFFSPTIMTGRPTIAYFDKEAGEVFNVYRENRILKRLNTMCKRFNADCDLDDFVSRFIGIEDLEAMGLYREAI
jgi:hypothetical protein